MYITVLQGLAWDRSSPMSDLTTSTFGALPKQPEGHLNIALLACLLSMTLATLVSNCLPK